MFPEINELFNKLALLTKDLNCTVHGQEKRFASSLASLVIRVLAPLKKRNSLEDFEYCQNIQ